MSYTDIYIHIIIYTVIIYIASITQPYPTAFLALSPSNPGNAEALCVKVGFWPLGNAGLFVGTSSPENWWSYPQIDGGNSGIPRIQFWDSDVSYLVDGWATPLKNMKVSWDYDIPNIRTNKKCSKPPTSYFVRCESMSCCLMEEQTSKKPAVRTTNCACEMDGTYNIKISESSCRMGPPSFKLVYKPL